MDHVATTSLLGAVALIALLVAVCTCLARAVTDRRRRRGLLLAGASLGLLFQLGHLVEHVAQVGYWVTHRSESPWMTPWATALARSFGALAPGIPGFGMEALHLVGNTIFLAGLAATVGVLRSLAPGVGVASARTGVWLQTMHVVEHVALTFSVVLTGRAVGLSTLFGALDAGPGLWTYRVWWHLTINVVATSLVVVAVARRHAQVTGVAATDTPALAPS